MPGWLRGFGTVTLVGIEGTGSYGAGLARHLAAAGIRVVEAGRADRQDRHRQGKSDPLDAVSAARAAQSGRASGAAYPNRPSFRCQILPFAIGAFVDQTLAPAAAARSSAGAAIAVLTITPPPHATRHTRRARRA
jgi:hypothetical protein